MKSWFTSCYSLSGLTRLQLFITSKINCWNFRQPISGLHGKISRWQISQSADGWTRPTIVITRFNVQLDNDSRLFSISRILTQVEVDPQSAEFSAPLILSETLNKTIIRSRWFDLMFHYLTFSKWTHRMISSVVTTAILSNRGELNRPSRFELPRHKINFIIIKIFLSNLCLAFKRVPLKRYRNTFFQNYKVTNLRCWLPSPRRLKSQAISSSSVNIIPNLFSSPSLVLNLSSYS